jgi:retron-type reverse transcriptase
MSAAETKPFDISKREVWEAYKRVKSRRGAAGIDDVSIENFEQSLSKNLYKIWNRMSSGSYFPLAVKHVEIPKGDGGTRALGIPTLSDRVAQLVVKRRLEPVIDPIFHTDSYGYRPGRSAMMLCAWPGSVVGSMIGCWIWILRVSSIISTMIF